MPINQQKRTIPLGGSPPSADAYTPKVVKQFTDAIAYLPLKELGGTTAADATANARNGAYGGTAGVSLGQSGVNHPCPYFPGANAAVNWFSSGLAAAIASAANIGTLAFWFKADPSLWASGVDAYGVSVGYGGTNRFSIYKENNAGAGRIRFNFVGNGTTKLVRTSNLSDTNWHHVAMTWDVTGANQIVAYLDGVQVSVPTAGIVAPVGTPTSLYIGADSGFNVTPWKGYLSDAILLPHTATAAEIAYLAASGGGGTIPFDYAGLVSRNVQRSWWMLPSAVEYNGLTYYTGKSYTGKTVIGSFDVAGNTVVRTEIATLDADDHDTPSLIICSDKPTIVCYGRHDVDNKVRMRIGVTAGHIDDLQAETTVSFLTSSDEVSYSQIYRTPTTNNLLLLARVNGDNWYYSKSSDYGSTWSTPANLFNFGANGKGYVSTVQDGNVLHVACYGHPTGVLVPGIFHCLINLSTGSITLRDGTVLGNLSGTNLPLDVPTKLTLIYPPPDHNIRLFDIDKNDQIAFETWTNDYDAVYKIAFPDSPTSLTWTLHSLVVAGTNFGYDPPTHYNGGVSFPNPSAGGVVFLSRESGGRWYLEKWVSGDNGVTWTSTLVESSVMPRLIRPYCPLNASTGYTVLYHRNTWYTSYVVSPNLGFNADLCGAVVN